MAEQGMRTYGEDKVTVDGVAAAALVKQTRHHILGVVGVRNGRRASSSMTT
jgi:hypothetical protein